MNAFMYCILEPENKPAHEDYWASCVQELCTPNAIASQQKTSGNGTAAEAASPAAGGSSVAKTSGAGIEGLHTGRAVFAALALMAVFAA
jgi:hypothetical protein